MFKTIYAPTPNGGVIELSLDEQAYEWFINHQVELNRLHSYRWQPTKPHFDDFERFMLSLLEG